MAQQLIDKVAIVTGANSGLGEAIALLFGSRGAKVTLCGRNSDRLKAVLDQVVKISGGHKDKFLIVQGDINQQNVRVEIVTKTVEKFGRLDILVANAGVFHLNNDIGSTTEESYDYVMNTNLKSVFFLIQQAVPHLEKSKGCVIGVSSMGSAMANSAHIYSMSKAALDHLFRCLALDLGPKGIRANTVNPSYIPTQILRNFGDVAVQVASAVVEIEKLLQPLEGKLGTSKDVAELVAFLASDAAGFITGENIKVDGGRSFCGPSSAKSIVSPSKSDS